MTILDALKKLAVAEIGNPDITVDDIPGKTTADVISYIADFKSGAFLADLTVSSVAGKSVGNTAVTVSPTITEGNAYRYVVIQGVIPEPDYLADVTAVASTLETTAAEWNGSAEITAEDGLHIGIYECDSDGKILKFGQAIVHSNLG